MEYRYLGKSGLQVSELSYGAWVTFDTQIGNDLAFECMDAAYVTAQLLQLFPPVRGPFRIGFQVAVMAGKIVCAFTIAGSLSATHPRTKKVALASCSSNRSSNRCVFASTLSGKLSQSFLSIACSNAET